ncbi:MAG TPA: tetratricopeptide repeat protein [Acidimicrobiales bacterium]|nr:tetratricopeptide repeat protein [Acidimicrobiales bacterium]
MEVSVEVSMVQAVTDRWGSPVSGAPGAASRAFDDAVGCLVALSGDPVALADEAAADGQLVMARVLQAYLSLYSTGAAGFGQARKVLVDLDPWGLAAGERELLHVRAAHAWAAGDWERAAGALERALLHDPRDLLALKVAQDLYFFLGDRAGLRDVVERRLAAWPEHLPGWGYVQGMYAFGLEENGRYAEAEARARAALGADAGDVWAAHALAHVFEMTGRQREGVAFLSGSAPDWAGSYFAVHNWWHRALYHLELGEDDEVLALYDGPIRGTRSLEWLDVVDAAALLWRLRLFGVDLGTRPEQLVLDVEGLLGDPVYVFNDWHAVMAAGLSGRRDLCDDLISANRRVSAGTNRKMVDVAGLDLLQGFDAFSRGNWVEAADHLVSAGRHAHVVGGSHAQRDVVELTLIAAYVRSGERSSAEALVTDRLRRKPAAEAAVRRLVAASS